MAAKKINIRWLLIVYDSIAILAISSLFLLITSFLHDRELTNVGFFFAHIALALVSVLAARLLLKIYHQIWRYGGVRSYMRLIVADAYAFIAYYAIIRITKQIFPKFEIISFVNALAYFSINLLASLVLRMFYRYVFKYVDRTSKRGKFLFGCFNILGHSKIDVAADEAVKIRIAIIGAGRIGTALASELIANPNASYLPVVFIDHLKEKIGRQIAGIPIISIEDARDEHLKEHFKVQEIVFAASSIPSETKKKLYDSYAKAGFRLKTYDFPTMSNAETGGKRHLRSFDIEELLFRPQLDVTDVRVTNFYKDKVVLVTGGGGSIGSEICRQLATMSPKQIIVLDIYENCAYDIQQELKMKYGDTLNLQVEILSITNKVALERVFQAYKPNIVILAAAHKHVPLMEHNVIEAVENNVFGTLNTIELAEKYGADRVHMVSTDKAVNPTSIMGATKRICEMICQSHSTIKQHTTFSITRFGNVLGSAGSVIPLFKRQIANGGPVTVTDKRIIRYFMTIPEASSLVLNSASMAKNGELFALDMGQPVEIYNLAVNMIKLSGFEPGKDIKIIETGLRPGEKLYEELLVKTEELDKTENSLIFIERDKPLPLEVVNDKLTKLQQAMETNDDSITRQCVKDVVPTFKELKDANRTIIRGMND